MKTGVLNWYEVADSHPAARTTMIHRIDGPSPAKAAAAVLDRNVALDPLTQDIYRDRFVLDGGWDAWRVSAPGGLRGRWVYTRPIKVEQSDMWPPRTWQDCVARYERRGRDNPIGIGPDEDADSGGSWQRRLARDKTVAAAMMRAMGTGDPMNPFFLVNDGISQGVLKATILDMRVTYRREAPGTRIEPRALRALLTRIGIRRATDHLVESHFIDRAEQWLYEQSAAGVRSEELDRLERRLLTMMGNRDFVRLARCCALASMCDLDPEAAELWYQTGGDCSGHPDIRAYAAQARQWLPLPPAPRRKAAAAQARSSHSGASDGGAGRLVRCGAATLTGKVCRHKVSPSTERCPAGHANSARSS